MNDQIIIKGAKQHNLKNVDLTLPRNQLIVFTGLSGSGKSSLAFDTIYAEGQRRYIESLSSYARLFLGQMEKPDVESIEGLSPAISIDQKTTSRNPRSTVGTVTEIHDYLRLLYARIGRPHCPKCGKPIDQQSVDQMVDSIQSMGEGTRLLLLAPIVRGRKGQHVKVFEDLRREGYVRVVVDGKTRDLSEEIVLEKNIKHTISVVIDRLQLRAGLESRMSDSIETALSLSGGLLVVKNYDTGEETMFSSNYACPDCGISIEELTPRMFSFNNPYGACPECTGLGTLLRVDPTLVFPDPSLSLREGAVRAPGWNTTKDTSFSQMYLSSLAKHYGVSMDTPVGQLPQSFMDILMNGSGEERIRIEYDRTYAKGTFYDRFEGIANNIMRKYRETSSEWAKAEYESYMANITCPVCHGARLRPEVLAVKIGGLSIAQLSDKPVREARDFLDHLVLSEKEQMIGARILKEIHERLSFLIDVGLDYITLSRAAHTLSGGEAQRIRLATQIGSHLMGVLYILDEPSIGLHQRDNDKLLKTLENLRDMGNTLIVVEHDEDTIRRADYVVDIGPGAGEHGGEVVAAGTPEQIIENPRSITGQYLSGQKTIEVPKERKAPNGWLCIIRPQENNLKMPEVKIPTGVITCVTGVSGSGKSTLINEILYKALSRDIMRSKQHPGKFERIDGTDQLDKVIAIDQSPIGRTPRSNPATYTGVFDLIRSLFAETPDARARGYKSGRFSFNVKGGRCEACSGDGIVRIEMHFLPDIYVPCDVCKGKRYNRETLEVRYKGKNISEVLEMTIEEAAAFFAPIPRIKNKLDTLVDVGLGYLRLGQPSTQLSGGEAQRVKLATELSRRSTGKTLYILDEPTTGLHADDVKRLVAILQRLAEGNNTVVVIEHNLDVIKTADYIIDLGPEGGDRGGEIVFAGTPEQIVQCKESFTGQYLKPYLKNC